MDNISVKKMVVISIDSYVGLVAGASHYWATLKEVDGPKFCNESYNTKAQARIGARELFEEHFGSEEYDFRGYGGLDLPWMYLREGD